MTKGAFGSIWTSKIRQSVDETLNALLGAEKAFKITFKDNGVAKSINVSKDAALLVESKASVNPLMRRGLNPNQLQSARNILNKNRPKGIPRAIGDRGAEINKSLRKAKRLVYIVINFAVSKKNGKVAAKAVYVKVQK